MSTIHFATFTVTGCCRICQFSLFSQVSTVGLQLDNSVSNAMPVLLVVHVLHTLCNFLSDWLLQDLPIFTFQPGVGSWCSLRQFCIKCHARATCFPCPPYILQLSQWLDSAGFANFLFSQLCLPQTWEPWCLSVFIPNSGQNYAGFEIFFGGVSQDL